jgi:Holliday junction resolvase RusA-like endonuclease
MDALAQVTMCAEYVHAVIYGPAPPSPRARATIVPVAPLPKLLARARHATKMSHLVSLFRAQLYMGRASKCEVWKHDVARCLSRAGAEATFEGPWWSPQPLEILILVVAPLPKGDHRIQKPPPRKWLTSLRSGDWDNLGKPICDAANGILWRDDVFIARASVEKVRAAQGETARLEILARPLQDSPDETRLESQVALERGRLELVEVNRLQDRLESPTP